MQETMPGGKKFAVGRQKTIPIRPNTQIAVNTRARSNTRNTLAHEVIEPLSLPWLQVTFLDRRKQAVAFNELDIKLGRFGFSIVQ
jgi:hypothetical protein